MVNVLHFVSSLSINSGLMSVIMNYYRALDRKKVQFGFMYFKEPEGETYKEEIDKLGGSTFRLSIDRRDLKGSLKYAFKKIEIEYDILHVHELYLMFAIEKVAREQGIKHIIGHAHTVKYSENLISSIRNKFLCLGLNRRCDYEMACSVDAGKVFFGNKSEPSKFCIINNAIRIEKYCYNGIRGKEIRKQLGISDDCIVVGHVGRFTHPKNHPFIIDIFEKLYETDQRYRLLLIGEGQNLKRTQKKVDKLKLCDFVYFLGARKDVNELYSAMNIFLFPSLYEGLGYVLIEAQANGLKCFASNMIPSNARILESFEVIDLKKDASFWAQRIVESNKEREKDSLRMIQVAGYDIDTEAQKLVQKYKAICGK